MFAILPILLAVGSLFVDAHPARRDGDHATATTNSTYPDTVYYTFTLTRGRVSPAGVARSAILVNGQTPGPTLEIEEGQTLSINVINHMDEDSTLHLHGLGHGDTPWYDGVPGVTQYPITPGSNFTYTVTPKDQYGQYWYHSHYKSQIADGFRGALLIHPSPTRKRPFHLISKQDNSQLLAAERSPKILSLTDWTNYQAGDLTATYLASGINPLCVDAFLINGKGQQVCPDLGYLQSVAFPFVLPVTPKGCVYPNSTILASPVVGVNYTIANPFYPGLDKQFIPCDATYSPLEVVTVDQQDGYASINLLFAGSLYEKKLSIDGHKFIIYAADGQYVEPYEVDVIRGAVGERYQAFIKLDNPGDWTIRLSNSDSSAQTISGYAVLSYTESNKQWTSIPDTDLSSQSIDYGGNLINNATVVNELALVPYPSKPPPAAADHLLVLSIGLPDVRVWNMDGVAYFPWRDQGVPAILDPSIGLKAGVAAKVKFGATVDIIFNMTSGNPVHPMHKHDNKAWIIGQGDGEFTWSSVAEASAAVPSDFNFVNPPYRDTYRTQATFRGPAWMAVRFVVDSLGPVFLHCHIDNHLQAGMAFVIMQGLEIGFPKPPQEQIDVEYDVVTANPTPTLVDGFVYASGA